MGQHYSTQIKTPIGILTLIASDKGITQIDFGATLPNSPKTNSILDNAVKQCNEYFRGERKEFTVPLDMKGSDFQQKYWDLLNQIPYGTTLTYKALATLAGNDKASRAAGAACRTNPVPVIVPCHRVVSSSGLRGYAGGLDKKETLLALEQAA